MNTRSVYGALGLLLFDVVDDVLHGVGELDGVDLVDERRRDEEGDDGADVEDEEHAVERQGDQSPFHRQSLLGVARLQLHHE